MMPHREAQAMPQATTQTSPSERPAEGHFLPDLCRLRAVSVAVLSTELLAMLLTLSDSHGSLMRWDHLALTSLFLQWVVLTCCGLLCRLRAWLYDFPDSIVATLSFLVILADVYLITFLAQALVLNPDEPFQRFLWSDTMMKHLLMASIIGGITLRYFWVQAQLNRRSRAEAMARLQALQARIQPHFLFNTMNSIASLISIDPIKAEQAVEDLSELFRATLSTQGRDQWADERELCERYLGIERLRLGERLQIEWDVSEVDGSTPIPMLTLQPILENAIDHGVQHRVEPSTVSIYARCENDIFELKVSNPLPEHAEDKGGHHMALDNIRHRLQTVFGDTASLQTGTKDGYFICDIRYPIASHKSHTS